MNDTIFEPGRLLETLMRNARNLYLEDGRLIEVTRTAKEVSGVQCNVDITKNLFNELFPYAEEANNKIYWKERMEELMKAFKVHSKYDFTGKQLDFDIKIETNVKKVHSRDEIETFKNSKKVTRTIPVYAMWLPDEKLNLGLLFGLRSS